MPIRCKGCDNEVKPHKFFVAVYAVGKGKAIESFFLQPVCDTCFIHIPRNLLIETTAIRETASIFTICDGRYEGRKKVEGAKVEHYTFGLPRFVVTLETIREFELHGLLEGIQKVSKVARQLYLASQIEKTQMFLPPSPEEA